MRQLKTSSGTFIIGGQAFAPHDALVTLRLTVGDWLFQPIPNGAQDWNDGVVYDSVADFIAKGAIAGGAARLLAGLRALVPVDADVPVRTPGQRAAAERALRREHGIPLDAETHRALQALAGHVGRPLEAAAHG